MIKYIHPEIIDEYAGELRAFLEKHGLDSATELPVDHLAIKMADAADFEQALEEVKPLANRLTCSHLNERRIATALLKNPLMIADFGPTHLLEIMEPRPHKVGKDVVGIDHMEMVAPDFAAAGAQLLEAGISFEEDNNGHHITFAFAINKKGQEFKFSDRGLEEVIAEELRTDTTEVL